MALKLIIEAKDYDVRPVEILVESAVDTGVKSYFIVGPFIQTNVKNRNGRKYPRQLMEQVVNKYVQDRMTNGFRSYGELGHPDGVEINLDRVSHYIKELQWKGDDCIGKAEILTKNPSGRIVETFLEKKLILGTSTRGLGSLSETANPDGSKTVTSYEMIASDIVADPSAPQGFVEGILENKEYIVQDNGVIVECYENLERVVSTLPKDSALKEKLFLEAFENFLKEFRVK